ncbi:Ribonuclease III [Sandaracinus amylolyticus]|uniref:Ribonuclease 3 n=1 Tax=Sandaracinus amylolyticus TaxID=927083 RepID=A0A0F6YGF7_9BACT|nr:Ribonuclease III [Sandaracinus amylolyticus]
MVDPRDSASTVAQRLGHAFGDLGLLMTALTHRSYVHEHPELAAADNERFEFLGDAIVGAAAAMVLERRFPTAREGELTRRRADLVNEGALATIAAELGIGDALRLGRGEERSGGRQKPRLLASALEACVAAIFLDAGIEPAIAIARALLAPRIDALAPGAKDFKSRLQERMQARGETPRYELERTEGPEHERVFHVIVTAPDARVLARGSGRTKLEAEQAAARAALSELERARETDG